ncbi:uridine kinase [Reichenbachiella faecimaris]|uniref:Uridine kinase n=1 Tax=Reichenbachiella faecimaris TaxID=692418 RepID=A0A1W2GI95_REIFA|nr:uridine kinase [Reichenbachiella faecimaris]SMD36373.1 uridine kinase [Reichenbachiella faecimaris]
MTTPYIVGITGGSASGKTLLLNELKKSFREDELCIVSQDNYYRPREEQPRDKKGIQNFDKPESIDQQAFAEDVAKLKRGETVTRQEYTFNNPKVTPQMLTFKPSAIIVVEGIFVFYLKEVMEQLDLKVFVDAKDFLMLKRRILRDAKERGYDLDDVLYRFDKHVMPTYKKYIKPYKQDADIIIPNNNDSLKNGLGVLTGFLKGKIS